MTVIRAAREEDRAPSDTTSFFEVEEVKLEPEPKPIPQWPWWLEVVAGLGLVGVMWIVISAFVWAWDKQWGM